MHKPSSLLPIALLAIVLAAGSLAASDTGPAKTPIPANPRVNVKDFGAKGDCRRVTDGTVTRGSKVFLSATANFTKEDIGQPIYVLEASSQTVKDLGEVFGSPLTSKIVSIVDSSTVILADEAKQNVSNAKTCFGTDDSQAIQKAIDSLTETGGTVYFPPGLYRVTYQGGPGLNVAASNIRLCGSGTASAIFNSSVLFKAKMKDGKIITEQGGVPALYVGNPKKEVKNVEVDHLWLGDNGQNYDYREWGAHGWGVLGCTGKIDDVHFHDLTIETAFLCGVNMDSVTDGFSIHHVTVLSSGEHGMYIAGTGSNGDVRDNRILGTTRAMRQGIAVKKKRHLRITHNEIANVDFQGICIVGDIEDHKSHDVVISENWLHDLSTWHTEGIVVSNAEDVVIQSNVIEDTSWIGISLRTTNTSVSKVTIKDNRITRAGQMNPCFAIAVQYLPPAAAKPEDPWPGGIRDLVVEDNHISDCPSGISFSNVGGRNIIRGNRVEREHDIASGVSYKVGALPGATVEMNGNTSTNYKQSAISPAVTSRDNSLK
ncbi:parallel beta helix pectate lyase-like protein [Roseimicrobium gellanilyticum]|uniref:Parallel beta helix pectate lyase-like protein n=1 Tax=Roseimicrobium gellanilyticum TaxID=748857 RepID=A0A366H5P5_9BACT|nr:right-handed parallel beta-helix repeat-containing protein [Roseimicrobium gellanilyticum]RBP37283.1 parallel beta helix pectate lyase-like protein [Roseimicrobium gellanilyticum]